MSSNALQLHPDRLFPSDPATRTIARNIYQGVKDQPIISPHGHTDPSWFAENQPFSDPYSLLVAPDHYLLRMLYSQGLSMHELGIASSSKEQAAASPREAWRTFAKHFYLFRGTPSQIWLNQTFAEVFGCEEHLNADNADAWFDKLSEALQQESFRPRALFERFNIEVLATTEGPLDTLQHHRALQQSDWSGRVITTYRPDPVIDPEHPDFDTALRSFGEITGEDVYTWQGYLAAHRKQRAAFRATGATATDHGHPTATTANLSSQEVEALFSRIVKGEDSAEDAELFRGQMLTEMARMSLEDGMVMQIHPGSFRNHNPLLFQHYGPDKGADIPYRINYTQALKPLLDCVGNEPGLTIILFTLDETSYSRELAPLAGHYPCLRLGPSWWFNDSPEGMRRFREQTTETAGFYNTVGFNDDTRAFFSIPARHDMARRVDSAWLARLVAEHRISEEEAHSIAADLTYHLPKRAYRLDQES